MLRRLRQGSAGARLRSRLDRSAGRTVSYATPPGESAQLVDIDGATITYPSSSLIGLSMRNGRGWDRVLVPILDRLVDRDDPVIVDVGANIGAAIAQFKRTRPAAVVVAFEPSSRFLPYLHRNIDANGWTNVDVRPIAVSSRRGSTKLHANATTASIVAPRYDGHDYLGSHRVESTTLDAALDGLRVDFLKVDTDGHELDVLLGARSTLERDHPVLFVEFDRRMIRRGGRDPVDVLRLLQGVGYERYLVLSNYGEALATFDDAEDVDRFASTLDVYVDVVAVARQVDDAGMQALLRDIGAAYSTR